MSIAWRPLLFAALSVGALAELASSGNPVRKPGMLGATAVPPPRFFGERPSSNRRDYGSIHEILNFSGPIQHVVVIYMENRTPDDLFGAYYNAPYPTGGTWGHALDLYNPLASPTLAPNALGAYFDPDHGHQTSFVPEAAGQYKSIGLGCNQTGRRLACPPGASVYSYVPAPETGPYAAMISNFAYANHVLQANEGPSYAAHQYAIAGQSGGLDDDAPPPYQYAPNAQAENPSQPGNPPRRAGNFDEETSGAPQGNCFSGHSLQEYTVDMTQPYPASDAHPHPPCAEYTTILDEISNALGPPVVSDWQYIASLPNGIWAAPMAINHLYSEYLNGYQPNQPFAVDPDALNFINSLYARNPTRPFAALTYVTPCMNESDHPVTTGISDGPDWLAYVVNAIGESKYWPNTTIIVTWDDWGGFFDHYRAPNSWPFHPFPNPYGNRSDPNEWGFRVPLIVISPYVKSRGYVSTTVRSQSAILNYIESTFNLGSLGADDATNGPDNLGDMFNFNQRAPGLPYIPTPTRFNPNTISCANG